MAYCQWSDDSSSPDTPNNSELITSRRFRERDCLTHLFPPLLIHYLEDRASVKIKHLGNHMFNTFRFCQCMSDTLRIRFILSILIIIYVHIYIDNRTINATFDLQPKCNELLWVITCGKDKGG